MSIEPQGFVVRRLADTSPAPQTKMTFDRSLVPAFPPPPATPVALRDEPVTPHDYGLGRQELRSIVGGQYTAFGHTTELGLRLGDVAGRLDTILIGAFGSRSMAHGAAIASTYRGWPVDVGVHGFDSHESRGVELRAGREVELPLARISVSGGGLFERNRNRGFVDAHAVTWQRRIASEGIDVAADSANHMQASTRAALRLGGLTFGAQLGAGRNLSLGGAASSIEPDSLQIARVLDPALERDSMIGKSYRQERLSIETAGVSLFWQRHHLGADVDLLGISSSVAVPPMPIVKTPALLISGGIARVQVTHKTRAWLTMRWRP
jgi:hypothetical protein